MSNAPEDRATGGLARLRRGSWSLAVAGSGAVIALAGRHLLGGEHSPFANDVEHFHHPMTSELVRAWSAHRLPLWTDRIYFGFPYLADPQSAAWYPPTLLVVALGPHAGYIAFLFLHAMLATLGTLALVRAHGGGWLAGWAAGLTLALSGYFAHELQHPGLFAILAWIPLWLRATQSVVRRPSAGGVAATALCVALMIFAGTLQVLFGALIVFAFYVAGLGVDAARRRGTRAAALALAIAGAAQLLGLALAAVVLLPAIAHLPFTARSLGMDYDLAAMGSVPPLQLLGTFAPTAAAGLPGTVLGFDGASLYLGALALPLAAVGLGAARRSMAIALGAGLAFLALLVLGRHGILHPFLFELLPGAVGGLRGVGRAIGPGSVCIALLAGVGLHRVGEVSERPRRWLAGALALGLAVQLWALAATSAKESGPAFASTAVVATALVGCALLRSRPQRLRAFLAGLVVLDLVAFGPLDGVLASYPPPPSAARVSGALAGLDAIEPDPTGVRGERVLLAGLGPRNLPLTRGFEGVGGYNPLVTLQYLDFVNVVNRGRIFPRTPLADFVHHHQPWRHDALFDAAGIRWVLSTVPVDDPGLHLIGNAPPLTAGGSATWLYRNEKALPRAYLAYRSVGVRGPDQYSEFLGPDFDGDRVTVVEGAGPVLDGPAEITPVVRREDRPESLRFDVAAERPAILVVSDSWYPGWRARVDGVESPIFRTNGLFRGVAVPAGSRQVEMRFEPWTFRAGAAISLAALVTIAALLLYGALHRP